MPTPNRDTLISRPVLAPTYRPLHTTCPPEDDRHDAVPDTIVQPVQDVLMVNQSALSLEPEAAVADAVAGPTDLLPNAPASPTPARSESDDDTIIRDSPSPLSNTDESKDYIKAAEITRSPGLVDPPLPSPPPIPTTFRISNSPSPAFHSSFLRNGSRFTGTQKSDRQVYNVQVEIKHVNPAESFVCGYLRIEGLTQDHPTLTTYFEGEIVGNKYAFQTRHADWGSNEKVDMHHWNLFQSFRPLKNLAKKSDLPYRNFAQREHIYMRWKEYFLVPDHRVKTITGASFEGFYYICFNQRTGYIEGFYFHHKSEKHQQLSLEHVPDGGCRGAMELR